MFYTVDTGHLSIKQHVSQRGGACKKDALSQPLKGVQEVT